MRTQGLIVGVASPYGVWVKVTNLELLFRYIDGAAR